MNILNGDLDNSLLNKDKKFVFQKDRILQIIDSVKYKSHIVDESNYKHLAAYLT